METADTFNNFLTELAEKVQVAKRTGWSEEQIARDAAAIGDWLARAVPPKTPEQKLLKELWRVADEREQQAIAACMVKLSEKQGPKH